MGTPTFVNAGQSSASFVTSKTAVMPASIVAGNLLIGFFTMNLTPGGNPTWPAGWTVAYFYNTSGFTISLAWKIAVGGDAAPTVTWTSGNTDAQISVMQYTSGTVGVVWAAGLSGGGAGVLGNIQDNPHPSGSTTAVSGVAVTTAAANTTVAAFAFIQNTGSVTVEPSGSWTREITISGVHLALYDTPMVSAGSAPAFSLTYSTGILYDVIEVEIRSAPIPITPSAQAVSIG